MQSIEETVQAHIEAGRTQLPLFEGTSQELRTVLAREDYALGEVEELISSDPVLTSGLLRLANSAVFGGLEKVASPRDAVLRLGAQQVSNLVLMLGVEQHVQLEDPALQLLVGQVWRHSVATAVGSEWLCTRIKRPELAAEAFVAGLLHDIGKLFLLRVVDDIKQENKTFQPEPELVRELMRSWHAGHGRALAEQWNLPDTYCHIIGHHHDADFDEQETLLTVVRLVDATANYLGKGVEPNPDFDPAASAEAFILRVGEVVAAELEVRIEDAALGE